MSTLKRKLDTVSDDATNAIAEVESSSWNNELVDQSNCSETQEYGRYSIPGLRFATESWAGMKTSNEDRHVSCADLFPGPVFGIFDGHGGTFTADFLARHLVKTVVSVLHQHVEDKALAFLQTSREQSFQEQRRKRAIVEQVIMLRQQLAELETLNACDSTKSADEMQHLVNQLASAISQIDDEVSQIDSEQAARRHERRIWYQEHHTLFLRSFHEAFERVDSLILKKNPSRDGSTALLAWFLTDTASFSSDEDNEQSPEARQQQTETLTFYLANVGDCRAVMCRNGQGLALTSDHKPDRPDERKRIEKAGGFVSKIAGIARVYSAAGAGLAIDREASTYLAVSRAFGDRSLKTPTPLVSCEPDIKRVTVHSDDLFLLLACDGIWDVLSEQDAIAIALPHFHDAKAAANAIVKAAYKKGSADNLTVTVIQFGWNSFAQVAESCSVGSSQEKNAARADASEEEIDMFNL